MQITFANESVAKGGSTLGSVRVCVHKCALLNPPARAGAAKPFQQDWNRSGWLSGRAEQDGLGWLGREKRSQGEEMGWEMGRLDPGGGGRVSSCRTKINFLGLIQLNRSTQTCATNIAVPGPSWPIWTRG